MNIIVTGKGSVNFQSQLIQFWFIGRESFKMVCWIKSLLCCCVQQMVAQEDVSAAVRWLVFANKTKLWWKRTICWNWRWNSYLTWWGFIEWDTLVYTFFRTHLRWVSSVLEVKLLNVTYFYFTCKLHSMISMNIVTSSSCTNLHLLGFHTAVFLGEPWY